MAHFFVLVNDDKIFSGIGITGELLWENIESLNAIQVVLFPSNVSEQIPELPSTAFLWILMN